MSALKKKMRVVAPTLEERIVALREELDSALNELAEERRPKGDGGRAIPVGWMRQEMDIRGGHCLCKSYLAASKQT